MLVNQRFRPEAADRECLLYGSRDAGVRILELEIYGKERIVITKNNDLAFYAVLFFSLACTLFALASVLVSLTVSREAASIPTYSAISLVGILGIFVGLALSALKLRVDHLEKIVSELQQTNQA